jgi:hypothetical protein
MTVLKNYAQVTQVCFRLGLPRDKACFQSAIQRKVTLFP